MVYYNKSKSYLTKNKTKSNNNKNFSPKPKGKLNFKDKKIVKFKNNKSKIYKDKWRREKNRFKFLKYLKDQKRNFRFKRRLFRRKISFYGNNKKLFELKNSFSRLLHIRVNPNNIFFNLKLIKPKIKTLAHASSGLFKVKLTKKRLSYNAVYLLDSFLSRFRLKIFRRNLIIVIVCPKHLKFKLIKCLSKLLKKRKLIVYIKPAKCFNGCRPPKKRRRKQKGLRILKK